jgi:hypothetical protein
MQPKEQDAVVVVDAGQEADVGWEAKALDVEEANPDRTKADVFLKETLRI